MNRARRLAISNSEISSWHGLVPGSSGDSPVQASTKMAPITRRLNRSIVRKNDLGLEIFLTMKTSLRTIARTFRLGRKDTFVGRKAALQGATANSFAELNSADKALVRLTVPDDSTHFKSTL